MAFANKYVTPTASGSGDGTIGNPWTLTQGMTEVGAAADVINILKGTYNITGTSIVTPGTYTGGYRIYRGYDTTIGDLEGQGRNADGSLNTTNFPVINCLGSLSPVALTVMQNLIFETSTISGHAFGSTSADDWSMISCLVRNTRNDSAARAVRADNQCSFVDCDFVCSGASHSELVNGDQGLRFTGCRFDGQDDKNHLVLNDGFVTDCCFIGNSSSGTGVKFDTQLRARVVQGCTFYDLAKGVSLPNIAPTAGSGVVQLINNHVTDCAQWIDSVYQPTANVTIMEVNTRTRANVTPRTGIADCINTGEITTDLGGGDAQDYVDAASGNLRLVSTAPGKAAGIVAYMDCGAYQREEPAAVASSGARVVYLGEDLDQ